MPSAHIDRIRDLLHKELPGNSSVAERADNLLLRYRAELIRVGTCKIMNRGAAPD